MFCAPSILPQRFFTVSLIEVNSMKLIRNIFLLLMMSALFIACKKNETSGSGGVITGDARIEAQVMHHYWTVPNCKVYIKKNCATFPGRSPSLYDSFQTADNSGNVQFDKLGNATYFLYAVGWDPAMQDTVWGYQSVIVNNKPGETKDYSVTVPVSE